MELMIQSSVDRPRADRIAGILMRYGYLLGLSTTKTSLLEHQHSLTLNG